MFVDRGMADVNLGREPLVVFDPLFGVQCDFLKALRKNGSIVDVR
jgi:hypothetical protein